MEYDIAGANRRLEGLFPTPRNHYGGTVSPTALMLAAHQLVVRGLDECLAKGSLKAIADRIPFGNLTLAIRDPEDAHVIRHLASITKGQDPNIIARALHQHWQSGDQIKIWRPLDHRIEVALYKNQNGKYQQ